MEIMIVVITVGAIAAFAIPNFTKSVEQSHRTDATNQLTAIYSAQQIYQAQTGNYWPQSTSSQDVILINSNLKLNIIQNGMTYSCTGVVAGTSFTCDAAKGSPASYTVRVTQAALDAANPSCIAGTTACP